jgi:hypothetical protein
MLSRLPRMPIERINAAIGVAFNTDVMGLDLSSVLPLRAAAATATHPDDDDDDDDDIALVLCCCLLRSRRSSLCAFSSNSRRTTFFSIIDAFSAAYLHTALRTSGGMSCPMYQHKARLGY